ncbi:hypothetical protein ACOJBO_26965 [Rhizobium beringeri]
MIPPAFNPLEKEGRHAMHIRKIVTLWNWTINGSGEKLQMPIGNDSGSIKTSQGASALDDFVSAGRQGGEFGPVELLFQHVKDIISSAREKGRNRRYA